MNNQDIVKEIIKKINKQSLQKAKLFCHLWYNMVKTQIYTDFLAWAPAEIFPDKLTYTKIDVKGHQTLVPKLDYTCKLEYYNNNHVYINFIIEKDGFIMYIMQKMAYDNLKARFSIIDQIYQPTQTCEFCSRNENFNIVYNSNWCNHRYFTKYEIWYVDVPARMPLFVDKDTYTIIVQTNGDSYQFNHKQPVPVLEENATLAALLKFLFS